MALFRFVDTNIQTYFDFVTFSSEYFQYFFQPFVFTLI